MRTALVGAGSFVKAVHVPNLLAHSDISVNLVVARRGAGATSVAKRFAGASAATDWRVAIDDPRIDLVFIGTRHDSHAEIAAAALDAGKLVFVEKPLGITREQLDLVWLAGGSNRQLIVGFNRRFATLGKRLIDAVSRLNSPIHVVYRVSAPLPSDHWLSDPDQGGGRVLGEMCHMFDFCNALCGTPSEVAAAALPSPVGAPSVETLNATVRFENGSVATIAYSGVGSSAMPKERVEVFCGGTSFVLDDFRSLTTFQGREILVEELKRSERGHRELLAHALDAFRGAASMQPGISAGYIAESVALATLESVADGKFIPVLTMPVLG